MLVGDVPQQKKLNVDCTFERCVRKANERKTTGFHLIKTGK